MTIANRPISLADQRHIVLDHVSWDFYERVLEEVGNRPIRVTFDEGSVEIMPPLPEHELPGRAIGALIQMLAVELDIPMSCYGSSTFRREEKQKGLEPDDCFYIANESRVRGMKDFDPDVHPPPDLAIEVDITRRSIPRQPIYAALGVPELWRFADGRIHVLRLTVAGTYEETPSSAAFPFLPMRELDKFVDRMQTEQQTAVLREFRDWVKTLPR
jgi:Uma2 family endonuclease